MKAFSTSSVLFACIFGSTLAISAACGSSTTTPGIGGDGSDGGEDASGQGEGGGGAVDASDQPMCTSGKTWTRGTQGSNMMQPGAGCIACHSTRGGTPTFHVAGTVYPSLHEPDECNGAAGMQVVVTDARGMSFTLTTNSAGNFACGETAVSGFPACAGFQFPFGAKVVNPTSGKTNVMIDDRDTGDCNSCHTQNGTNIKDATMPAPGRIKAL